MKTRQPATPPAGVLHAMLQTWQQAEPPEFHWRLLHYFCWTRLAVGLLLLGYIWLPSQRGEMLQALPEAP